MNWSKWIRQFHRWVSVAFVGSAIATTVALAQKEPVVWMSYVPLLPPALLALTGSTAIRRASKTRRSGREIAARPIHRYSPGGQARLG